MKEIQLNNRGKDIEEEEAETTYRILSEHYVISFLGNSLWLGEKFTVEPIEARCQIIQISLRLRHLTVGLNSIV